LLVENLVVSNSAVDCRRRCTKSDIKLFLIQSTPEVGLLILEGHIVVLNAVTPVAVIISHFSTLSTVAHRSPMLLAGSVSGRPHSKWWWCHDIGCPLLAAEHSLCSAH